MPDKKLTDKEIVKALEVCCTKRICKECIYLGNKKLCIADNTIAALDLINRLQAENERLKEVNEKLLIDFNGLSGVIHRAKAKAYKEFAERLKENFKPLNSPLIDNRIDNLLKEMVADNETIL